jgi:signal transduction histidine kinase
MVGPELTEWAPRPPLLHRVTPKQLQIVDFGIAMLVVLFTTLHTMGPDQASVAIRARGSSPGIALSPGAHYHIASAVYLALAVGLAVALRRRLPMTALFVATVAVAVAVAGQFDSTWLPEVFLAIPVYQVASVHTRRESIPTLALVCVALLVASFGRLTDQPVNLPELALVAAVAAWFVGDSVRVRRLYMTGLSEQAAQHQREVIERAQRSVAEERLQIARELHDVVAHSLSVIAVQSGVGRHVIDDQPAEAKKALAAVEETSRAALTELRRMLGVLRRDDAQPATLEPAPGIAAIGTLVEQVRSAGFPVSLDSHSGMARTLAPTIQLTIYRIIQEALTNVVKHAGPATVRVEIRDEANELVLEVNDDGRGIPSVVTHGTTLSAESHHGITGMRERVELFDGSLLAGPRPQGGFRVVARFPFECLIAG